MKSSVKTVKTSYLMILMLQCHPQYTFITFQKSVLLPGYTTDIAHHAWQWPGLLTAQVSLNIIAICPAILDQCPEVEHELLISEYKQKESDIKTSKEVFELNKLDKNDNQPHNMSPSPKSNYSSPCSNVSSPSPYYRTDPKEYCQKCKNEISEAPNLELPVPVQFFDFTTIELQVF